MGREEAPVATRPRILLVDDSPVARAVARMCLSREYEVVEAGSAARALQLLRVLDVALVVTDCNMPGGDGLDFVRALRGNARKEVSGLRVVLITGETGGRARALEAQAKEVGVAALLYKPVTSSGLAELVRTLAPVTA